MKALIFGCGYLGSRVASQWIQSGLTVYAITRSRDRAALLEHNGINPIVADITNQTSLAKLPEVDVILFAVGFDPAAGYSIHHAYVDGLNNSLNAISRHNGRLVYISSTGVYGHSDGAWVDESSHCKPIRKGGKACLAAETLLRKHPLGKRVVILRLAGIYGPGRIPNEHAIRQGEPIARGDGFVNLIHVDDATQSVTAAMRIPTPTTINVSDGQPVRRRDFYREFARLLDAPEPTFLSGDTLSNLPGRHTGSKRVDTARMRRKLNITLQFPSYVEGLSAIFGNDGS